MEARTNSSAYTSVRQATAENWRRRGRGSAISAVHLQSRRVNVCAHVFPFHHFLRQAAFIGSVYSKAVALSIQSIGCTVLSFTGT